MTTSDAQFTLAMTYFPKLASLLNPFKMTAVLDECEVFIWVLLFGLNFCTSYVCDNSHLQCEMFLTFEKTTPTGKLSQSIILKAATKAIYGAVWKDVHHRPNVVHFHTDFETNWPKNRLTAPVVWENLDPPLKAFTYG